MKIKVRTPVFLKNNNNNIIQILSSYTNGIVTHVSVRYSVYYYKTIYQKHHSRVLYAATVFHTYTVPTSPSNDVYAILKFTRITVAKVKYEHS